MSSALTRLLRLQSLTQITARRTIASKPAKSPVSAKETMVGLTSFVVCFLIPSGWILANMESYKKRD